MRKKKQTSIDRRVLKAEYLRIVPEQTVMLLPEDIFENFDIRVGFVHQGVVSHVETIGTPEELGAHDAEKEIAIPRLACFVVLVTQVTLHRINRLPTLFKHAVWETIDSAIVDKAEIPEILLVVINDCLERAIGEINYSQLKDEHIVNRLWSSIKSAYGEKHAPNDSEIFDNFHESEDDLDEEELPPENKIIFE